MDLRASRGFSREVKLRASLFGLGLAFAFVARLGEDTSPVLALGAAVGVYLYLTHLLELESSSLYRGALVTLEAVLIALLAASAHHQSVGLFLAVCAVALSSLHYGNNIGTYYALLIVGAQLALGFAQGWPPRDEWPSFFLRLSLPLWASYLGSVGMSASGLVDGGHLLSQRLALEKAQTAARSEMEARRQREQELYDERRRLESLMEVSQRMGMMRSPDELLATVVICAKEQLQVNTAIIMLRHGDELCVEWKDGLTDLGDEALRTPVGQGLLGQMVMSGQPFRFTSADNYESLRSMRDIGGITRLLAGHRKNEPMGPNPRVDEIKNFMGVALKTPQDPLPFGLLILANRLMGDSFSEHELGFLQILATDAAIAIRNLFFLTELECAHYEMIQALAQAIEAKDSYTHGHVARVRDFSVKLARSMGLPADYIRDVDTAAILHDVGKLSTPDSILMKPGALTDEEFAIMKLHSTNSVKILRDISSVSPSIQKMVLHHHERWDGRGYPSGLQGNEIPLGALIVTVADCYDAMTSDRPYRKGFVPAEALRRLEQGAGTQFSAEVLSYFLALWNYEPKSNPALLELTHKAREKVGVNLMRNPDPSEMRRRRGRAASATQSGSGSMQLAGPSPGEQKPRRLEMDL